MNKFEKDFRRVCLNSTIKNKVKWLLKSPPLRSIYYLRRYEISRHRVWLFLHKALAFKMGNQICCIHIGGGMQLVHAFGITINPEAIIGENFTIFKGATIGSVRSGKRAGIPIIGNNVVVCCNAMICGGVSIGNDVLIAANSFVDFDVPDHSIVLGNPGIIMHKMNATKDYLNNV